MHVWGVRAVEPRCLKADRWEPAWEKRAAPAWEKGQQACTPRDLSMAPERRVSSNCTIVFGTLQPKTEMRGKYMIFSTFFQLAWAVKTGAMALHTMRCPFISCLDLSWMYTWYISLYVLQPHPDCVHNPGVAARHIKWYTMMCVSAKKVSQREVPKRCQDRSHDKKHAPFILLHLISVEQSVFQTHKCELEISYKYIYIYWDRILWSQVKLADTIYWQGSAAHTPGHHIFIFFLNNFMPFKSDHRQLPGLKFLCRRISYKVRNGWEQSKQWESLYTDKKHTAYQVLIEDVQTWRGCAIASCNTFAYIWHFCTACNPNRSRFRWPHHPFQTMDSAAMDLAAMTFEELSWMQGHVSFPLRSCAICKYVHVGSKRTQEWIYFLGNSKGTSKSNKIPSPARIGFLRMSKYIRKHWVV